MSVDFPEPEMPVRTVRRPSGMAASMCLRLFAWQPVILRKGWVLPTLRREPRVGWIIGWVSAR
jgi:hypothetical protein